MQELVTDPGFSVFLTGLLAILLAASWMLKNWAAGAMWALSTITLIFVGVFGVGIEFFWLSVIGTLILLLAGMVVRWAL